MKGEGLEDTWSRRSCSRIRGNGLKRLPHYADEPDIGCATPQCVECYREAVPQLHGKIRKILVPYPVLFFEYIFCPLSFSLGLRVPVIAYSSFRQASPFF